MHACLLDLSRGRCRIACKPKLADFLQYHTKVGSFNKVGLQHVDFLVCRREDWLPMVGIEMCEAPDNHQQATEWDLFINNVFASASIPLVRTDALEIQRLEPLAAKLSRAWWERWEVLAAQALKEESRPALRWN